MLRPSLATSRRDRRSRIAWKLSCENLLKGNLRLQRFAERFLRLVMLVTGTFVKLVRALANYIGTHRHALTTVFARPLFGGGQQPRARSQAALPVGDDQPVHFRAHLRFQQRLFANVQPSNDSVISRIRNEYSV